MHSAVIMILDDEWRIMNEEFTAKESELRQTMHSIYKENYPVEFLKDDSDE